MKLLSDINIHFENKKASRAFFVFIWIMYALVYMTKSCFSGALAIIKAEGALTLTQASWIISAFYIVYTPLQVVGGKFADKYSPEKLILISLIGGAISNFVIYLNQNFWVMLVAWSFNAAIQFSLWPAVYKIASSQLAVVDRTKMVFALSFCSSFGLLISYGVAAFITKWQLNFLISSIVLLVLAIVLLVFCSVLNPSFSKPEPKLENVKIKTTTSRIPKTGAFGIFLASGFLAVLPAVFFRTLAENGSKTFSSTMLFDSYLNVSPTIGNLLNVLIIIAAPLGMILVKSVLFPRIIKNEMVMFLILLLSSLPFTVILIFIGTIPVWLAVVSLCVISMTLSGTQMLTQFINLKYVKYGLSGTAAGVLNCAASFGFVIQYCLLGSLADAYGWKVVTILWAIMITLGVFFILIAVKQSKQFAKTEKEVSWSLEENNDK